MPLYLDVNIAMSESGRRPLITGATYGLASKEFTPAMVKAVFDNLNAAQPRNQYVIGIEDDVTHSSLEYGAPIHTTPETTKQCLFWGLGSDGTVGANKTAIKVIGLNTDLKAQGHFVFDSHKVSVISICYRSAAAGFPRLLESSGFFLENSRTWKFLENQFGPGNSFINTLESHAFLVVLETIC